MNARECAGRRRILDENWSALYVFGIGDRRTRGPIGWRAGWTNILGSAAPQAPKVAATPVAPADPRKPPRDCEPA